MKAAKVRFAAFGCPALTEDAVHVTGRVLAVTTAVHSPVRSPSDFRSHGAQGWAKKRQPASSLAVTLGGRFDYSSGLAGAELGVGFEEFDTSLSSFDHGEAAANTAAAAVWDPAAVRRRTAAVETTVGMSAFAGEERGSSGAVAVG